jgi:hypothetical protein
MIERILELLSLLKGNATDNNIYREMLNELQPLDINQTVKLTNEQENMIKRADFDLKQFTQLLSNIHSLLRITNSDTTTTEEKDQRIAATKTRIFTYYSQIKPKNIQQLKDEERISEIAQRYNKLKYHIEVEYLILKNNDGKTFIHYLFENKASVEDVIYYINQVNKFSYDMTKSYFNIYHDQSSALDLIIQKSKSREYEKLRDLDINGVLVKNMTNYIALDAHTHTSSLHESIDQSLVRLTIQYIKDNFSPADQRGICLYLANVQSITDIRYTNIIVNRLNKSWQNKIEEELDLFMNELTKYMDILEGKDSQDLMNELFPYSNEETRNFLLFQCNAAKILLSYAIKKEIFGQGEDQVVDPVKHVQTVGVNLCELLAISYGSIRMNNRWNETNNIQNYFFSLINGMYVSLRGYNIDKYGEDEWKHPNTKSRNINKCVAGIFSSIVQSLIDHQHVTIITINQPTTITAFLHLLPTIMEILFNRHTNRTDLAQWFFTGTITNTLLNNLADEFFKIDNGNIYNKDKHLKLVTTSLNAISKEQIEKRFISYISDTQKNIYSELQQLTHPIDTFVRDSEGDYILLAEYKAQQFLLQEISASILKYYQDKIEDLQQNLQYSALRFLNLLRFVDNSDINNIATDILSRIEKNQLPVEYFLNTVKNNDIVNFTHCLSLFDYHSIKLTILDYAFINKSESIIITLINNNLVPHLDRHFITKVINHNFSNVMEFILKIMHAEITSTDTTKEDKTRTIENLYFIIQITLETNFSNPFNPKNIDIINSIATSDIYTLLEKRKFISILWIAISNKQIQCYDEVFKKIIEDNIPINNKIINNDEQTILHLAVYTLKNPDLASSIIRNFPHLLNEQDKFGATALHYAIINNSSEIINILLQQDSIDLTRTLKNNQLTPYQLAASLKNENFMKQISDREISLKSKQEEALKEERTWVKKISPRTEGSDREL